VTDDWQSVSETHPEPNERVLIATDDGEVGIGHWEPDAGWLLEIEMGEMEVEPLYWMSLPLHPGIEVAL
jgi:hypothetical protein